MAKKKREEIVCCICKRKCKNYGYNLCSPCYKKFIKGLLEHPEGILPLSRNPQASDGGRITLPRPAHSPDSDVALIDSGNPFDLPFGAEVFPAGADNPTEYLQQECIADDADERRLRFVEELVRAA